MYRLQEIVESFKTLVGWRQGTKECHVEDSVTASDSGMYFQEAHPLLTLRSMKAIMPRDLYERHPGYGNGNYKKGDVVSFMEGAYISLRDDNFGHSVNDTNWWKPYNTLTDYCDYLTEVGVKQVINRFIRDKVIGMESKNIIDRRCLFDGAGRIDARIENRGRLVGFELKPMRSEGITTQLHKVGVQFTGNHGDITLYLFHSSSREPIRQVTISYTKSNGTMQWFDLEDFFLPYVSADINAGGSWYLVYDQNALPDYMEAINFSRDWSREPCMTCNQGDVQLYRLMTRYMNVSPFCVNVENWDGQLWDIQDNCYTNTTNYGLNLQFSIGCDLTDFMIGERLDFASAVQLQVANNALRALAMNPENNVNRVQANVDRNEILYALDGNGMAVRGLHGDLEKAYKALSFDTKGMADVCLTCKNKGIRFRSI